MRSGENPHQQAAFYAEIATLQRHLGGGTAASWKELSYNNINDANELWIPQGIPETISPACGGQACQSLRHRRRRQIHDAYVKAPRRRPGFDLRRNRRRKPQDRFQDREEIEKIFLRFHCLADIRRTRSRCSKRENIAKCCCPISRSRIRPTCSNEEGRRGLLVQTLDTELFDMADVKVVTAALPPTRNEGSRVWHEGGKAHQIKRDSALQGRRYHPA